MRRSAELFKDARREALGPELSRAYELAEEARETSQIADTMIEQIDAGIGPPGLTREKLYHGFLNLLG